MATSYANTGQFDLARKRAEQRATAEQQQQDDVMKRRFAAQGALNSGAYVKQQQIQADAAMKRKAEAIEGIDVAEAAEAQRQREVLEGRDFARSERLGSQEFTSGESALQRRFLTGEREATQGFQSGEAEKQRGWATNERIGTQDFTRGEREATQMWQGQQNGEERRLKELQLNAQIEEWMRQYGLSTYEQNFNSWLAINELNANNGLFAKDIDNPYTPPPARR